MWIVGRLRGYNLRSRFSLALRWRGLLHGLRFLYALLERLDEVNDLCMPWRLRRCNGDLPALFVAVALGLKFIAHVLNQGGTEFDFLT